MLKTNFKWAGKVFGLAIFAGILAFFIYISLFTIFDKLLRAPIGYEVMQATESGDVFIAETHYFAENEAAALPATEMGQKATFIRSELDPAVKLVMNILQVICCFGTYLTLCASEVVKLADKDRENEEFGGKVANRNRGLYIGLMANVPSFVLFVGLIVSKIINLDTYLTWLYLNMPLKPVVDLLTGDATKIANVSWWVFIVIAVLIMLMPLACHGIYRAGLKDNILNKIIYKQKKKVN